MKNDRFCFLHHYATETQELGKQHGKTARLGNASFALEDIC